MGEEPELLEAAASTQSVKFIQNGQINNEPMTDSSGRVTGQMVGGPGGQGKQFVTAGLENGEIQDPRDEGKPIVMTNHRYLCCDCDGLVQVQCCGDVQDEGFSSVHSYSGEKILTETLLAIPGRGLSWAFQMTYRSQAAHLSSLATGDFGTGWAYSYADDRLIEDGRNVIHFKDTCRTDVFRATAAPNVWKAPMEYYQQLRLNDQGNFELRHRDGIVRTYEGFDHPNIPGRLIRKEDRRGNFMSFLYEALPSGKYVLKTVVDTMGRNIVYRYWRNGETSNQAAIGRLRWVEDFYRDNSSSGRRLAFFYDEEGNLVTGSLMDYSFPNAVQLPEFLCGATETPSPHNPLGVKGCGEAGAIGAPPTVVNAILDALRPLGVEHVEMPVTSDSLWTRIQSVRT
jgi:hypothetical protein